MKTILKGLSFTQFWEKKKLTEMDELSVGFKTFEMEMNEMSVYLQYNRKMSILEGQKCKWVFKWKLFWKVFILHNFGKKID